MIYLYSYEGVNNTLECLRKLYAYISMKTITTGVNLSRRSSGLRFRASICNPDVSSSIIWGFGLNYIGFRQVPKSVN